jgi:hypothetical protein
MGTTRSYTLNIDLARQVGMSSRITHSGRYVGRFTRAELIESRQKTEGVAFTFGTDTGQVADFLSCWTHKVEGRELYGLKVLNAILTCMRLREIAPRAGRVQERNGGTREARVFPQLLDKPIGQVLQREEYLKQDGTVGWKFSIVAPFDPATGMTAAEILGRAEAPTQLARIVESVRDKVLPRRAGDQARAGVHPGSLADIDEDIPF